MTSLWPSSIDFTPRTVLVRIGKKASTAATMTFEVTPKPNQTTKSGTSATLGITCVAMMKGFSVSSSQRSRAISTPRVTPMSVAQKKPASVA